MGQLAFSDEDRHFYQDSVRFKGLDGHEEVLCAVTHYALQHCDDELPKHGLISSEAFLAAFDRLMTRIHHAARTKYAKGLFEAEGSVKIMIHRQDLAP